MAGHTILCRPGQGALKLHRLPHLGSPLLKFDLATEIKQLHKEESWKRGTGRSSKTLAKHLDFRVVLIAMKARTRMHEHKALARISIQTLTGYVRLRLPEEVVDLPAGSLLALDCAMPHDVEAVKQSAFLLTLSWPHEKEHGS